MSDSGQPQYIRVKNILEKQIVELVYPPGTALPTERELGETFSVSRITIRKAIDLLATNGLVHRIQGSGTFVKYPESNNNIYKMGTFGDGDKKVNQKSLVIEFFKGAPPKDVAQALNISEQEEVFYCKRLRSIEGSPVILEESWMPVTLFPDLTISILEGHKYDYVEKSKGYKIFGCEQKLEPINTSKEQRDYLQLPANQPALKMTSVGTFTDGRIFEYSVLIFNTLGQAFSIKAVR